MNVKLMFSVIGKIATGIKRKRKRENAEKNADSKAICHGRMRSNQHGVLG